ncbi:MAG: hypothetical protein M3024_02745 [Candidatus Dormibacteraeota bacterium]|nr:hypothetical protein [Candidatus Dormibacteraeota bacterium]
MTAQAWILVALAVIVVILLVVVGFMFFSRQRRSRELKEGFGPEYDRTLRTAGGRQAAEAELASRQERREGLEIRELSTQAAAGYAERWQQVQVRFVDAPADALREADVLLSEVMRERGYPVEDFDQRAADISVDHPALVENYRAGHEVAVGDSAAGSSTEDRRQAFRKYRALFEDVLGEPGEQPSRDDSVDEPGSGRQEVTR